MTSFPAREVPQSTRTDHDPAAAATARAATATLLDTALARGTAARLSG